MEKIVNLQGTWQQMTAVGKELGKFGFQTLNVNRGKVRRIHVPDAQTLAAMIALVSEVDPASILTAIEEALPTIARICVVELKNQKTDLVIVPRDQSAEIRLLMQEEISREDITSQLPTLAETEIDGAAAETLRQTLIEKSLTQ